MRRMKELRVTGRNKGKTIKKYNKEGSELSKIKDLQ